MKAALQLPKGLLDALAPADVEAYLRAHGWKADAAVSSPDGEVYHHPADPKAEVLVPRDKDLIDYALRMSEVLQALAAAERRTAWELLEDLSGRRANSARNGPAAGPRGAGAPPPPDPPWEVA